MSDSLAKLGSSGDQQPCHFLSSFKFQHSACTWILHKCFRAQLNDHLLWEAVSSIPVCLSSETLQHLMLPHLVAHREVTVTERTKTQASPLVHYRLSWVPLHPSKPVLSTDLWVDYSWMDISVLQWSSLLRPADPDLGKLWRCCQYYDELLSKRTGPRKRDHTQGSKYISNVKQVLCELVLNMCLRPEGFFWL